MDDFKEEARATSSYGAAHMTLLEVGGVLGLTRERVRQIEVVALRKLRAVMRRRGISAPKDLI